MDFQNQLDLLQQKNQLRQFRALEPLEHGYAIVDNYKLLNLSSNDYLGIANNTALKQEFHELLLKNPSWMTFSASSSRLLSGNNLLYDEVERLLGEAYGRSALFFNSGYHANVAILPALTSKNDLILSDKLVHASLIDGIQLCRADHIRYRHNDYDHLRKLLLDKRHRYNRVIVVTESIFSMDGDLADLQQLVQLKSEFDALLYLDEAHALGMRGLKGLGVAEEVGLLEHIDLLVGTLGKALGSVGAFVICNKLVRQWLINKARPLIYSTALPPINMGWTLFVIQKVFLMDGLRERVHSLVFKFGDILRQHNLPTQIFSHIIPIPIGDNKTVVQLSEHLKKKGILVLPIRPPTVPEGTSRLRISLSAAMHWDDLKILPKYISDFLKERRQP